MSQNAESDLLAKCTLTFQDVENAAGSGDDVWLLESQTLETPNDEGGLANAAELGGTGTPNPTALKLPARDATVDEVREYIVATLVTSHETSAEFAHKTALKWNLGRGWCLLDLPSARFTEIFGLVGPHLEWDVRDGKEKEIRARRAELQPAKDAVSRRVRGEESRSPRRRARSRANSWAVALMGIGLVLAIAAYTFTEKCTYSLSEPLSERKTPC